MLSDSALKEGNFSRSLYLSYFISEYNSRGSSISGAMGNKPLKRLEHELVCTFQCFGALLLSHSLEVSLQCIIVVVQENRS